MKNPKKVSTIEIKISDIKNELRNLATPEVALRMQRFFADEHKIQDQFIGVKVPLIRSLVKQFQDLSLKDCDELLQSPIHEERMLALLLLVRKYRKARTQEQEKIVSIYLKNTAFINQWDLIDLSAEFILGPFLENKDRKILYKLAQSSHWWERRIAIITTFHFIRKDEFEETLQLAKALLKDPHDLVQKGVGWMLKEIAERNREIVTTFLKEFASEMPRTMLRYAIEKFPEKERQYFLISSKRVSKKKSN